MFQRSTQEKEIKKSASCGMGIFAFKDHQLWQGYSPLTAFSVCSINLCFCHHRCVVFMTDLLIGMVVFIIQPKFAALERT